VSVNAPLVRVKLLRVTDNLYTETRQCCCQGLTSRGQGLGVRGQGQGPGLAIRRRGQGLRFQMLKHLLNNDIHFLE